MKPILILSTLSALPVLPQQAMVVHSHNVLPEVTGFLDRHAAAREETFPLPA